jgi:prepilin-type N-terminal cleavage/methylation domain-containing protein
LAVKAKQPTSATKHWLPNKSSQLPLLHSKPNSARHGFTLIEIMAVVLLLGLALGGVSSNLNAFIPAQQSESAAREVIGVLDLARSAAIANGRPYYLEVDLDQNQYRVITPYTADGRVARTKEDRTDLGIQHMSNGVYLGGFRYSGVDDMLISGVHTVEFNHSGFMNDLVILLRNVEGEAYDLTIVMGALSGKTLVYDGGFSPGKVTDADF